LKGGMSFGGPCFPRDNRAFAAFADQFGLDAPLAKATDTVNDFHLKNMVDSILAHLKEAQTNMISILGLAYKPNVPVIEESAGINMINEILSREDIRIIVYDPLAMDNVRSCYGDKIVYASSVKVCFINSSVLVITVPSDEFTKIDSTYIVHDPTTIIDCWRTVDPQKLGDKVKYVPLGRKNHL